MVTVGSALKDIMFYSGEVSVLKNPGDVTRQKLLAVEYGAKIPIKDVYVNYGGGALNVAVGLKNFGIDAGPMARMGNDQVGKEIYSYLKDKGIGGQLVQIDKEAKTGFSIIVTAEKDKEHTIFIYKGANENLEVAGLRDFRTEWFYVSSLYSRSWALEFDKICRQTRRGVKIAWNPGTKQLAEFKAMARFLEAIEVVILNKDEAIGFVKNLRPKIGAAKLKETRFLLERLKELGARRVVITHGDKGAFAIDETQKFYYLAAESEKHKIVDTVGAGDAFSSGLIAGLVRWNDFERALHLAMRNSANVLYRIGAQNGLLKIKL